MNESSLKDQLDELAALKQSAMDAAETYKEGVDAVSKSSGISKGAITKYIAARLSEKLERLEEETSDIEKLLGRSQKWPCASPPNNSSACCPTRAACSTPPNPNPPGSMPECPAHQKARYRRQSVSI